MGDFFESVGDVFGSVWDAGSSALGSLWEGVSGIFGGGDSSGGDVGLPAGIGDFASWPDIPGFGGEGPDLYPQAGPSDAIWGSDSMSNGMTQVGWPAAAAAGGIWLGSLLTRALGGAAAGAVYTAANGVRVRMSQLWPLVRKYGSQAVAGGLGISLGALGTLLAQPEAMNARGRRGRGRGISNRDVKTTRRTLKTIRKLYHMMPTRRVYGGGGYRPYRRGRR